MPISRLLIIIADRCPWHVLLVDAMSVKLREQGVACGVIGLVEQGILDAASIAGLRRLADKTGGAWDLANGRELSDAIHALGSHLYRRAGKPVATCEIVVLDHGHLTLFRDCVEIGVQRLADALTKDDLATNLLVHWRSQSVSRLPKTDATPLSIRPWRPPKLDLAAEFGAGRVVPSKPSQPLGRTMPITKVIGGDQHSQAQRSRPGGSRGSAVDRLIQWGLWLSGGALLSALTLLTKK